MVKANAGASVLTLHDAVTDVLALPGACFCTTVGLGVLLSESSLAEAGVNANSVVRDRAWILRGRFLVVDLHKPAVWRNKCWPMRSRCFRCGSPKCFGGEPQRPNSQDLGRPPYPPPGWQAREQTHPGSVTAVATDLSTTTSKKRHRQHMRMQLRPRQDFLLLSHSPRCRRWELLKGDIDGDL